MIGKDIKIKNLSGFIISLSYQKIVQEAI